MSTDLSSMPCFTISEAANYLRISRALLYRLISEGQIHTVKIGKRTIVRGPELERFLDEQQDADRARRSTSSASAGGLSHE
jgi:excisionase family DNA binding protein